MLEIEEQGQCHNLDQDMKYDKTWRSWVLFRHWQDACNIAWVVFFSFLLPMGISNLYASHPLCPYDDQDYPRWYWNISYGVLGIWLFMWIALLMKLSNAKSMKERVPHLVAVNIISMSVISSILEMVPKWNGVCIDALGVASSSNIWAEWIACGPLLVFITVALDHKTRLSRTDWVLMVSFAICLVAGFLIILPGPYEVGVFWFVVSFVTFIPILYLPYYAQMDRINVYDMPDEGSELIMVDIRYVQKQRSKLAMVLCISFSLFPVNYVLAWAGVIEPAACIAVYRILSVITKGLFVVVTMDMHFDILMEAEIALITLTDRKANEARRAFLKYIFHEVRSPLNSLSIGIELLSNSSQLTGEEDIESLTMMKDASGFINDTLNNVLSMQQIEEGKLDLELSMFSLASCITRVFATFRGNSTQKNIRLTKHISAIVPPQVLGDKYRIEHVIANLLGNAIKFSPIGSTIQVNVDATERNADNECIVTVSVVDCGMGISASDQLRLFNDFVQIRPGLLQKGRGSGLGLAISKQIVELHKGHIGVKSEEGQGSTFYFSIPFKVGSAEEGEDGFSEPSAMDVCMGTKPTRASNFTSEISPEMQRQLRVLIVDDSESNRKMLKMLLKKSDIPVLDTAEDGAQAVDTILGQGVTYDIVFMDNLMPIMNGVDATMALRQGGFENLVVGVTGNVLEEDMLEYFAAGADLIIPKPMRASTLHALIDFARREGCKSISGMRLVERKSGLRWEYSNRK